MIFSTCKICVSPSRCNLGGCKVENPQEKQNPGSIDLQCPGESKWRDYRASLARNLNRRDCPQGRSLVSVEKSADEISSTGGRRRLSPRPFGPEFENVLIFPTLSANFRKLPAFSAFCWLFPPVSGNFEAVLNWTFGLSFTLKGAIPGCNRPGCSITAALSSKS